MRIYLSGPIFQCSDTECRDWREFAKRHLFYDTCDPMDRDYRGREESDVYLPREIVEVDKHDIDGCDVILVNYSKPSVGTSMEILYGWERGKIIVLVSALDSLLSPWLRYHAHYRHHLLRHAVDHINRMKSLAEIAKLARPYCD
jgi:nucleoside 2-deoxyribosyltransferase